MLSEAQQAEIRRLYIEEHLPATVIVDHVNSNKEAVGNYIRANIPADIRKEHDGLMRSKAASSYWNKPDNVRKKKRSMKVKRQADPEVKTYKAEALPPPATKCHRLRLALTLARCFAAGLQNLRSEEIL